VTSNKPMPFSKSGSTLYNESISSRYNKPVMMKLQKFVGTYCKKFPMQCAYVQANSATSASTSTSTPRGSEKAERKKPIRSDSKTIHPARDSSDPNFNPAWATKPPEMSTAEYERLHFEHHMKNSYGRVLHAESLEGQYFMLILGALHSILKKDLVLLTFILNNDTDINYIHTDDDTPLEFDKRPQLDSFIAFLAQECPPWYKAMCILRDVRGMIPEDLTPAVAVQLCHELRDLCLGGVLEGVAEVDGSSAIQTLKDTVGTAFTLAKEQFFDAFRQSPHYEEAVASRRDFEPLLRNIVLKSGFSDSVWYPPWTLLDITLRMGWRDGCSLLLSEGGVTSWELSDKDRSIMVAHALSLGLWSRGLWIINSLLGSYIQNIQVVDLRNQGLLTVPPELESLTNLVELNLSSNMISLLPNFILRVPKVILFKNPLNSFPPRIRANPTWEAVSEYLLGVVDLLGHWPYVEITIVLFIPMSEELRHVIQKVFNISVPRSLPYFAENIQMSSDLLARYSVLYIGEGMESYGQRHMLSPGTLHVLCFDDSVPFQLVNHVVRTIRLRQSCVSAAPHLLGIHVAPDSQGDYSRKVRELMDVHAISPKGGNADPVSRMEEAVLVSLSKYREKQVSVEFARMVRLVNEVECCMTHNRTFVRWAIECGVSNSDMQALEEFMYRVGMVHKWGRLTGGKTPIVLRPYVLPRLLADLRKREGPMVTDQEMLDIVTAVDVSPGLAKDVCGMLDSIGAIVHCSFEDRRVFLCPFTTSVSPPNLSELWNIQKCIEHRRVFRFPFHNPDLIHIMQAAFLHRGNFIVHSIWRHGLVMSSGGNPVLVISNPERREVEIKAKVNMIEGAKHGDRPLGFIEAIEQMENIISTELKGVEGVERIVPCVHCLKRMGAATPWEYKFEDILELVSQGVPFVYCSNEKVPSRCVQISRLAPDVMFSTFNNIDPSEVVIERELGQGAFGKVMKGTWKGLSVAVKGHHLGNEADEEADVSKESLVERYREFWTEAFIMSYLDSPFLVRLHGVSMSPLRLVMEYVPCGDLYHLLHGKTPTALSKELQVRILLDVSKALGYLQSISPPICHRDLRSPNIFISSFDVNAPVCAKVADFGMSQQVAGVIQGALMSWRWLAPEVLTGDAYDSRCDIYSFGMIMFETLTANLPFEEYNNHPEYTKMVGENEKVFMQMEIKTDIIEKALRPTPPTTLNPALAALMARCWEQSPNRRPKFDTIESVLVGTLTEYLNNTPRDSCNPVALDEIDNFGPEFEECEMIEDSSSKYSTGASLSQMTVSLETSLLSATSPSVDADFGSLPFWHKKQCEINLCSGRDQFDPVCTLHLPALSELWLASDLGEVVVVDSNDFSIIYRKLIHNSRIISMFSHSDYVWCFSQEGHVSVLARTELALVAFWRATRDTVSQVAITTNRLWLYCPLSGHILSFSVGHFLRLFHDGDAQALRSKLQGLHPKVYVLTIGSDSFKVVPLKRKREKAETRVDISVLVAHGDELFIGTGRYIIRIQGGGSPRVISSASLITNQAIEQCKIKITTILPYEDVVWTGTNTSLHAFSLSTMAQLDLMRPEVGKTVSIKPSKEDAVCSLTSTGTLTVWDVHKRTHQAQRLDLKGGKARCLDVVAGQIFVSSSGGRIIGAQVQPPREAVSRKSTPIFPRCPVSPFDKLPSRPQIEVSDFSQDVIHTVWHCLMKMIKLADNMKQMQLSEFTSKTVSDEDMVACLLSIFTNAGCPGALDVLLHHLQQLAAVRALSIPLNLAKGRLDRDSNAPSKMRAVVDDCDSLQRSANEIRVRTEQLLESVLAEVIDAL